MEKEAAYFIAIESDDAESVAQKMSEIGECINLVPGLYLLVTEKSKSEILFALDPLRIRSLKRYFVIESTNVIWNVFDDERQARIQAIINRLAK